MPAKSKMLQRFRGYLPVVIDLETGGLNANTDAILEMAAFFVDFNEQGLMYFHKEPIHAHIVPFEGGNLDKEALEFNKIDPFHPFRFAIKEREALLLLFDAVKIKLKETGCKKAVVVAHNAWFDLSFLNAAIAREKLKSPFHSFTTFDTATLGALCLGQTVLRHAVAKADVSFQASQAHSAIYDAEKTTELFCYCVNKWHTLGGWNFN